MKTLTEHIDEICRVENSQHFESIFPIEIRHRNRENYLIVAFVSVNKFLWQEAAARFDGLVEVDGLVLRRVEIVSLLVSFLSGFS